MVEPPADAIVIAFPASGASLVRDPPASTPAPSQIALLGPSRAAVLAWIAATTGVTTGQLASALRLSGGAASRHATVLREAGLITTIRVGMTVHHHATRVRGLLVGGLVGAAELGEAAEPDATGP